MAPLPPFKLGASVVVNDDQPGSRVVGVVPGSLADRIKMKPGDVLYRINRRPIESLDDVVTFLAESSSATRVTFWQAAVNKFRDVRVVQLRTVGTDEVVTEVESADEFDTLEPVP